MKEHVFSTQLTFVSQREGESAELFYRRIKKGLYRYVREFCVANGNIHVAELTPEDCFIKSGVAEEIRDMNGRLLCHFRDSQVCGRKVFLLRTFETRMNNWCKAASDHSLQTEIIAAIVDRCANGVRKSSLNISVRVWVDYQPFAGFFKTRKLPRTTPAVCEALCQIDDVEVTFAPVLFSKEDYEKHPEYRAFRPLHYPIQRTYSSVRDAASMQGFAEHLCDPFRPVPLLVFFGDTWLNRREAAYFAFACWSKCRVWVLRKNVPGLKVLLENQIKSIDVTRNFRLRLCRVFFPAGQYRQDDAAQPTYWVPILNRHHLHKRIKIGLMRFYGLDSTGWITSATDLAWAQYDEGVRNRIGENDVRSKMNEAIINQLRAERNSARRKSETAGVRLDAARSQLDDANRNLTSLRASSDEILNESVTAVDERDRLLLENADLKNQLLIMRGQGGQIGKVAGLEKYRLSIDDAPNEFDTLRWCAERLFPHVAIAPEAWDNMNRKKNNARLVGEVWRMLWNINDALYQLLFVTPVGNVENVFHEKTGYLYSHKDSSDLPKEMDRERDLVFEGREWRIQHHVKKGSRDAVLLRVYFDIDYNNHRFVVGSIGDHLTNIGTSKNS